MDDRWLVAIALCIAATGMIGLLLALLLFDLPLTTIPDAKTAEDGAVLQVKGTIISSRTIGTKQLVTISQPSSIDVVIDDNATVIRKGGCFIIQGKKSTYNEEQQIVASRITTCSAQSTQEKE